MTLKSCRGQDVSDLVTFKKGDQGSPGLLVSCELCENMFLTQHLSLNWPLFTQPSSVGHRFKFDWLCIECQESFPINEEQNN